MPKHTVYPTGVPPVCTAEWDQDAWYRFESNWRPDDYNGGDYDKVAWAEYLRKRTLLFLKHNKEISQGANL